jgi:hypothetical protein
MDPVVDMPPEEKAVLIYRFVVMVRPCLLSAVSCLFFLSLCIASW